MTKFSTRLKELRKSKDLSQQKLADMLRTSKSSVNMYERGEREPGIDMIETIADIFNIDVDYLFGKTEIPNRALFSKYVNNSNSTNDYSDWEHNIIVKTRKLNDNGRNKTEEYVSDLVKNPIYTDKKGNNTERQLFADRPARVAAYGHGVTGVEKKK